MRPLHYVYVVGALPDDAFASSGAALLHTTSNILRYFLNRWEALDLNPSELLLSPNCTSLIHET